MRRAPSEHELSKRAPLCCTEIGAFQLSKDQLTPLAVIPQDCAMRLDARASRPKGTALYEHCRDDADVDP